MFGGNKHALKQVPARKCQHASDECQHVSDRDAKNFTVLLQLHKIHSHPGHGTRWPTNAWKQETAVQRAEKNDLVD